MNKAKRERLETAGWRVGDARDFRELSDADSALIEIRISLAQALKERRIARRLSQSALATQIGSSQSRVAKMEAGGPSVSIDLLLRTLVVIGSTRTDIGKVISASRRATQRTAKKPAPTSVARVLARSPLRRVPLDVARPRSRGRSVKL